jgi:4-hydroxy-tetrahydrodipicolinate synthase
VAVKDATGDLEAAPRVIADTGLAYYSGDDGLLLPFLAVGGVGLVSMAGHLVGDTLARTIREFDAGDPVAARASFLSVLPVIHLISGSGNGALRSKLSLALLGLIPTATMRLPQAAADQDEVREVRAALVEAGLLQPARV